MWYLNTYHQLCSELGTNINKSTVSASMPVIPCRANLEESEQRLEQFLFDCQQQDQGKENTQVISLAQQINSIDPLAFLQAIAQPNQLHFYWENPSKNEAIAAIGATKSFIINSPDRFLLSRQFVQDCWQKTIRIGDVHLPEANPYLFCGFTFFPTSLYHNSPFPAATIFMPQFQVVKKNDHCVLLINLVIPQKGEIKLLLNKLKDNLEKINQHRFFIPNKINKNELLREITYRESNKFKNTVTSALQGIETNNFSKIVLATVLDVVSPKCFNIVESLHNLRQKHPDCYIFSISNSQGVNFIGASPERLISIKNKQLITDALAGSAPRGKTLAEDEYLGNNLLNSEKERREHRAVSEFIIKQLKQLGIHPQRSPVKLLQLSNIQHLWTPIYAQLSTKINPLDIVAKLHPTPAVAGVPTDIALTQIRNYETFDRTLYAAPLGWIDYQGNAEFIVGIRSALIENNKARLYAGAGIVAGSNPDKELAEVQLKLQSLLQALV